MIRNGSFEKLDSCPNTLGQFAVNGWYSTHGSRTTPDLFSTCGDINNYSHPENYIIRVLPHHGQAYVGIVGYNPHDYYREYISTKLVSPLVEGKEYLFRVAICQPAMSLYYLNELGIRFTKDSVKPETLPKYIVSKPHIKITDGEFLKLKDGWFEYEIIYRAIGGETYLHLGCLLSEEQLLYRKYQERMAFSKTTGYRDAYYLIDDVSLIKLNEEEQPLKTFVFSNINFNTGDFSSGEEEFSQFDELLIYLTQNPEFSILIEGHTDDVGEENDNLELSQERALFVKAFFEHSGIVNEIKTIGYGELKPIDTNETKEGRAINRRVVIHVFENN